MIKTIFRVFTCVGAIITVRGDVPEPAPQGCVTFKEAVTTHAHGSFATLVESVATYNESNSLQGVANLGKEVQENQKITIFVPSNEAIETIRSLNLEPPVLTQLLYNHVVALYLPADRITASTFNTVANPTTRLSLQITAEGQVEITPEGVGLSTKIASSYVECCAGTIHFLDSVLLTRAVATAWPSERPIVDPLQDPPPPPRPPPPPPCNSVAQAVVDAGHRQFLTSVQTLYDSGTVPQAAPLVKMAIHNRMARQRDRLTMFIPSDTAFRSAYTQLQSLSNGALLRVFLNHLVEDNLTSVDFPPNGPAGTLETVHRSNITLQKPVGAVIGGVRLSSSSVNTTVSPAGSPIVSNIEQTDIVTCAGSVNIINAILFPADIAQWATWPGNEPQDPKLEAEINVRRPPPAA